MATNRRAAAAAAAVLLAFGCSGQAEDLQAGRATWDRTEPAAYSYTYRGGGQTLQEARVTVADGKATVEVVEGDPEMLNAGTVGINAVFHYAEEALREADDADIDYDDAYGYPESAQVDRDENAIDDEYGWRVKDFKVTRARSGR